MNSEKIGLVRELHQPARVNYPRRKIVMKGKNETWSADLIDMSNFARTNKGNHFILLVIDNLSKFVFCETIKKKNSTEVHDAFLKIFERSKVYPKFINTDRGREFLNSKVSKLFEKNGIKHFSTNSETKAAIAERAIRTIKKKIYIHFAVKETLNYVNYLQDIVYDYNHTKHRTIGMSPASVTDEIAKKLLQTVFNYRDVPAQKILFKVGDFVRISKMKKVFEKSYNRSWSNEVFRIKKVQYTIPATYVIEDLKKNEIGGHFYTQELKKTKFPNTYLIDRIVRRKGDKILVKWQDFDEPTWEEASNILN